MFAIINQNASNNGQYGVRHNNGNGKFPNTKTQKPEKDQNDMLCGDLEVLDIGEGNAQHLDKAIVSLLNWPIEI